MKLAFHSVACLPLLALLGCHSSPGGPADPAIPADAAAGLFREAADLCGAEGGRLWGHSLCGPMLLADSATLGAVCNQALPDATADHGLFRLTLPAGTGIANTSIDLHGTRWTMLMWPLPDDSTLRHILLMHESYHRIQPSLGLVGGGGLGTNTHLDTRSGRVWLRAELHALRSALQSDGDARKAALVDALAIRAYRRSLWPSAPEQERALELNEGLAESTGIAAALPAAQDRARAALRDLATHETDPSYVRSFAYATGAAYGELLTGADPAWRRRVTKDFDFGVAAAAAYRVPSPAPGAAAAEAALSRHEGAAIVAQEDARQSETEARDARYTAMFLTGSTVTFPLGQMSITFDPNTVKAFGDHGTVYGTLQITDTWGTLTVTSSAALVPPAWDHVTVPTSALTAADHVAGDGWTASLNPGFALAPVPANPGSFRVVAR